MQRVAQAKLMPISGLVMWTTTEVLLNKQGPLAPIWLQGHPQISQATLPDGSLRQCAFEMVSEPSGRCTQ